MTYTNIGINFYGYTAIRISYEGYAFSSSIIIYYKQISFSSIRQTKPIWYSTTLEAAATRFKFSLRVVKNFFFSITIIANDIHTIA